MESYGPAVLRWTAGAIFVAHGAQELLGLWGDGRLAEGYFAQPGLAPPFALAVMFAALQFAGGLMFLAGALTRPVSVLLIVALVAALWTVHVPHGFFINWALTSGQGHGYEFNLLLTGALVALLLTGPGALSIDHRRARSAEADAAGRARLRGKL